ncbi:AtpZ/AtpI family protein [Sulfitobacter sp. JB4-11]|uniref:AtpZ/AtpI family protein n=1 Tax=Sulfitobacter rhodophyticola TaxID=3238304 RepID=UPI003D81567A
MTDPDQKRRMERLEAKIDAAKRRSEPTPRADEHYSQAQLAWRMVIELVAGLGIGFGMGYGLDWLFGTLPIFMVIFTMLGLAAGVKTMLNSAREVQEKQVAEAAENDTPPSGKDDTPQSGKNEGA